MEEVGGRVLSIVAVIMAVVGVGIPGAALLFWWVQDLWEQWREYNR